MTINQQLIHPNSIAVIGASNDISKPGGKLLSNLIHNGYAGELYVVNRASTLVQGIQAFQSVDQLPDQIDLAIISIPAIDCIAAVKELAYKKNTRAFIILSAGFGEAGESGKKLEADLVKIVNDTEGCLIGPNCIGILNSNYSGIFTLPVPPFEASGCDLISSSGATAVFLIEAGIPLGVKFANIYSLGNAAQTRVEDVLEYMDHHFDPAKDPPIKLLYLESIHDPQKFLKHAKSLIQKGAKIAAIKAGSTEAGSRAAASHTGALSSSDVAVRALFRKANIIYCSSRMELLSIASIFHYGDLQGKNFAIITHAGGSAVMLTDALIAGGLQVPEIDGQESEKLLTFLNPGSSVSNPIDFLATGTAEQLGIIIDYCEHKFDQIDAMIVVFGSPGLFNVANVYDVLSVKLDVCKKPIFPVLPSVLNAENEIQNFLNKGNINFPDEVALGKALCAISNQQDPKKVEESQDFVPQDNTIRTVLDECQSGFVPSHISNKILDAAGIPRIKEYLISSHEQLTNLSKELNYPIVMKAEGLLHKSDSGGVILNIPSLPDAHTAFDDLLSLDGAKGVVAQHMAKGLEVFIGIKKEEGFGHLVFCGIGGVLIEVLKDFSVELCPISKTDALNMIRRLNTYKLIQGYRGNDGIDEIYFAELICRVAGIVQIIPEITELDINPLIGTNQNLQAVDVRIRIEKDGK